MHRRTILRAALAAPTLFVRRPGGSIRSPGMPGQLFCDLTSTPYAGTNPVIVPPPFSVALPIPPELSGPDISLRAAPAEVELIPGMSTRVLAYDGTFPGPTIVARPDEEINVDLINAHGDSLVVHLHGGHTPAAFDGHPFDTIAPGEPFTYRYPNRQSPATLWYHDHGMMTTASNVYHGLAGLYLLRDPTETALGLPVGGPADIPLVLTDKTFDDDGQLVYPQGQHDGFFGDVPLVNGAPHPLGAVPSGLVRLRILNASNARAYQIHRSDGIALLQIASDGGLLAEPVLRPVIELWPAERVEVLLDLQDAADGEEVTLVDGLQFREGLVRFVVSGRQDSAAPPLSLRGPLELDEPTVIRDFSLGFDQTTSTWLLNGHDFDVDILDATPRLGEVERWRFTNTAPGSHPMHLHQTSFIVRARKSATKNPLPLEAGDVGWKDTVVVRQGQTVEVDVRFDDFPGTYVYHCHILEHEDHGMMSQFRVLPTTRLAGTSRVDTAIAASKYTHPDGAQSVVVASGETFADALAAGPVARALEGPLLLVTGQTLPASVEEEIRRLAPARIVVTGGVGAIPHTTVEALERLAATERVAGGSREDTAVALSRRAFTAAEEVWIATRADFPDALVGGAAAAAAGVPVLLARPDGVSQTTMAEIRRLGASRAIVVGGSAVLGTQVASALIEEGLSVQRLAGPDRFATAAAVAAHTHPGTAEVAIVVTGSNFPDALAAAPLAAATTSPILLVDDMLPAVTAATIGRLAPRRLVILGGQVAVPEAVEQAAVSLLD